MGLDGVGRRLELGVCGEDARVAAVLAPGQMTLTRICHGAHSRAAVRLALRKRLLGDVVLTRCPCGALTPFREHRLIDGPVPLGLHDGQHRLHPPERAEEAHGEAPLQLLVGGGLHAAERAAAPGVVHQDVDRAPGVERPSPPWPCTSSLRLASVWTKRTSAPNSSWHAAATSCAGAVVDLGHQDVGALGGEPAHNAPPDAVTPARDDRHLAPQSIGHAGQP